MNFEDNATIRNAILKRLDKEPGVQVADIRIEKMDDCIAVGVWAVIMDVSDRALPDARSFFDLPLEFAHAHLLNEIDEIAEQIKAVRKKAGPFAVFTPDVEHKRELLVGTGRRGRWYKHA